MSININFFWKGNNFTYLNRLCILSHIAVGHTCNMWLSGDIPQSKYWIGDILNTHNANDVFDVSKFITNGGNLKTASDLWRFNFLYQNGGVYCDTDALAIKEFPNTEWILCSSLPEHPKEKLSIGVIGAPEKQQVFSNCIKNIKEVWGNVTVFGDEYEKIYGNTNSTHDDKLFYPYTWRDWNSLFTKIDIPDVYSVHLYHTMLERNNMIKGKDDYLKNEGTLIYKLINKFDGI